jgi:hypothetical protein
LLKNLEPLRLKPDNKFFLCRQRPRRACQPKAQQNAKDDGFHFVFSKLPWSVMGAGCDSGRGNCNPLYGEQASAHRVNHSLESCT